MPFFHARKANPVDSVIELGEKLNQLIEHRDLDKDPKKREKISGDISRLLTSVCNKLESQEFSEHSAQLCHEIYNRDIVVNLIKVLPNIEFETRKDISEFMSLILSQKVGSRLPTVDYILKHPKETIFQLIDLHQDIVCCLNVGLILREGFKNEDITRLVLGSEEFYKLFHLIMHPVFDISSDAFMTFKELLSRHKEVVGDFVYANYDRFIPAVNSLMESDNYVIKRQSIKLLGELLLENSNHSNMIKYVSSVDNLKIIMTLLCSTSLATQYEAFHVFKIFIANPSKTEPILAVLRKNKEKLLEFFKKFNPVKDPEEQFLNEKEYVLKAISLL